MALTAKDFKTEKFTKNLNGYIDAHPLRITRLVDGYLDEFINELLDYAIPSASSMEDEEYRNALKDSISSAESLRRGYCEVIDTLFSADTNIQSNVILSFFERLGAITDPALVGLEEKIYTMRSCFHFNFVRHELFLNTVATALKYRKFELLDELFSNRYLWLTRNQQVEDHTYNIFQFPIKGDHFNPDELIALKESEKVDAGLIKADMLCYFAGMTRGIKWLPKFHYHVDRQNVMLDFILRMRSKKYCKQVYQVFGVNNVNELITKIDELKNEEIRDANFETYPTFSRYILAAGIGNEQ